MFVSRGKSNRFQQEAVRHKIVAKSLNMSESQYSYFMASYLEQSEEKDLMGATVFQYLSSHQLEQHVSSTENSDEEGEARMAFKTNRDRRWNSPIPTARLM